MSLYDTIVRNVRKSPGLDEYARNIQRVPAERAASNSVYKLPFCALLPHAEFFGRVLLPYQSVLTLPQVERRVLCFTWTE